MERKKKEEKLASDKVYMSGGLYIENASYHGTQKFTDDTQIRKPARFVPPIKKIGGTNQTTRF